MCWRKSVLKIQSCPLILTTSSSEKSCVKITRFISLLEEKWIIMIKRIFVSFV